VTSRVNREWMLRGGGDRAVPMRNNPPQGGWRLLQKKKKKNHQPASRTLTVPVFFGGPAFWELDSRQPARWARMVRAVTPFHAGSTRGIIEEPPVNHAFRRPPSNRPSLQSVAKMRGTVFFSRLRKPGLSQGALRLLPSARRHRGATTIFSVGVSERPCSDSLIPYAHVEPQRSPIRESAMPRGPRNEGGGLRFSVCLSLDYQSQLQSYEGRPLPACGQDVPLRDRRREPSSSMEVRSLRQHLRVFGLPARLGAPLLTPETRRARAPAGLRPLSHKTWVGRLRRDSVDPSAAPSPLTGGSRRRWVGPSIAAVHEDGRPRWYLPIAPPRVVGTPPLSRRFFVFRSVSSQAVTQSPNSGVGPRGGGEADRDRCTRKEYPERFHGQGP